MFTSFHVSYVTCHVSRVTCQKSHVGGGLVSTGPTPSSYIGTSSFYHGLCLKGKAMVLWPPHQSITQSHLNEQTRTVWLCVQLSWQSYDEMMKSWNAKLLKYWNAKMLKCWHAECLIVEMLKYWNNDMLKCWNTEMLIYWNIEMLKF